MIQLIRAQCNADITPLIFARTGKGQLAKEVMEVSHVCHNFDEIRKWAGKHTIKTWDRAEEVDDDPLGWGALLYKPPLAGELGTWQYPSPRA